MISPTRVFVRTTKKNIILHKVSLWLCWRKTFPQPIIKFILTHRHLRLQPYMKIPQTSCKVKKRIFHEWIFRCLVDSTNLGKDVMISLKPSLMRIKASLTSKNYNIWRALKKMKLRKFSRQLNCSQHVFAAVTTKYLCPNCQADHLIYSFKSYKKLTSSEGFETAKKAALCLNFLRSIYRVTGCIRFPCLKFSKTQNIFIHFQRQCATENTVLESSSTSKPLIHIHVPPSFFRGFSCYCDRELSQH